MSGGPTHQYTQKMKKKSQKMRHPSSRTQRGEETINHGNIVQLNTGTLDKL